MRNAFLPLLVLSALFAGLSFAAGAEVVLNADTYQLTLGADGTPTALVNPQSGNVLDPASRAPFLSARVGGTDTPATAVSGEGGRITAPIEPMRFDDALTRLLGPALLGLGDDARFMPSSDTWGSRHLQSVRAPGGLVEGLRFTL